MWPNYLALDGKGDEYERQVIVIGELPREHRMPALSLATMPLVQLIGKPIDGELHFGVPAHTLFGMTLAEAKKHDQADILLLRGEDLPVLLIEGGFDEVVNYEPRHSISPR